MPDLAVGWRRETAGDTGERLVLTLYVQPGARKSEIGGVHGDALKVRLAAPPVEGKANAELLRYLSHEFGVAARDVTLMSGEKSRRKIVCIENPRLRPDAQWVRERAAAGDDQRSR